MQQPALPQALQVVVVAAAKLAAPTLKTELGMMNYLSVCRLRINELPPPVRRSSHTYPVYPWNDRPSAYRTLLAIKVGRTGGGHY